MKLDECRAELNRINGDIAWDIVDEKRIKQLNKDLAEFGYMLLPCTVFQNYSFGLYDARSERIVVCLKKWK